MAAVALVRGVNANLVRKWIAKSKASSAPTDWLAVTLHAEDPVAAPSTRSSGATGAKLVAVRRIEIDLGGGTRIRIQGTADIGRAARGPNGETGIKKPPIP